MKIIFVGIHNKEGRKPLDPLTHTGEIVTRIILQLAKLGAPDYVSLCVTSNVYDQNSLPLPHKLDVPRWAERVAWEPGDISVRLGKEVQERLSDPALINVDIAHPGYLIYKTPRDVEKYILDSAALIFAKLTSLKLQR